MKKLIVSSLAVLGLALSGYSQGVITFDGSLGGHVSINGVADTATDINAELLYNNGTMFVPVVTLLLSASSGTSGTLPIGSIQPASGDITFNGDGSLYDNSGNTYIIPLIAGGSPATFEVEAWTGSFSSLAAAVTGNANTVTSGSFVETLTLASSPILAACDQMPAINLVGVPEPATMALAGLGVASLLAFRRRK